jgi:hypothetical protein
MSRTLPAHLVPIRERIARSDYTVLRNGGEQLVRDYARELGVPVTELIRSWAPPIDDVAARRRNAQPEPEPEPDEDDVDDRDDPDGDDEEEDERDRKEPDIDVDDAGGDLDDEEEDDDAEDDDQEERRRR